MTLFQTALVGWSNVAYSWGFRFKAVPYTPWLLRTPKASFYFIFVLYQAIFQLAK